MKVEKKINYKRCVVRAPASTANLGPGFDVFGLALDVMYDTVEVTALKEKIILIEMEGVEADTISINPKKNSAGRTAHEFIRKYHMGGVKIKVHKGIPPGSGLGSSGASASATAVALNALHGLGLNKIKLTEFAAQGEIAAAGTPHADNVTPSIYGGFVIIRSYHPFDILKLPPPVELEFALAVPKGLKKTTKKARDVLPKHVPLEQVINNLGAASSIIVGLLQSNASLIGKGMLGDQIVEPIRATLYPGYLNAKKAALETGAYGATLSGAGPTIIAVVDPLTTNTASVAKTMKEAYEAEGIECYGYVSQSTTGAQIIEKK